MTEVAKLEEALDSACEAWACWSTTNTNVGVDFLLGRDAFAQAFGVFADVPFDLETAPGVVLAYGKIAKAQALAAGTGAKAVLLIQAADGLFWCDLAKPGVGTIERTAERETWPTESHGGAPLVYRLLGSALKPLRKADSR